MIPPPISPGYVVVDASALTALCAREPGRYPIIRLELERHAEAGDAFFAPHTIVSEVLYALCRKLANGELGPTEYEQAILGLHNQMRLILPPPGGEPSLVTRAVEIRAGYGCSRSADSLYIALAEELTRRGSTVLLTFDRELPNQAARNAPSVTVNVLTSSLTP